jgi:hypothetical protein
MGGGWVLRCNGVHMPSCQPNCLLFVLILSQPLLPIALNSCRALRLRPPCLQELLPEKRFLFYPNLAKAVGSAPLAARLAQLSPDVHLFGHTHFAWEARLGVDGGKTRYIQAPLCSPRERQRRLMTVGFETSMAQAEADPAGATWLPLCVYQGLADGRVPALEQEQQHSGQQQQETQQLDMQQQQQSTQQLHALAGEGWEALRHGVAAPPLDAHWSSHYASNARQPEVVQMAPWVAKLYERRQQRAARGASAASSVDGGLASGSESSDTD